MRVAPPSEECFHPECPVRGLLRCVGGVSWKTGPFPETSLHSRQNTGALAAQRPGRHKNGLISPRENERHFSRNPKIFNFAFMGIRMAPCPAVLTR